MSADGEPDADGEKLSSSGSDTHNSKDRQDGGQQEKQR